MTLNEKNPLQNVFNKISDAIIISDLDYTIKAWNKAAERIYGWKAEKIIGKSIFDTIKIEYADQSLESVKRQFEEEGSWKGYVIQYNKNGERVYIYSSVSIVKGDSGTRSKIVAINQNLTERKKIEEKLRFSEQKYKLIVENAHEGIWIKYKGKDADMIFLVDITNIKEAEKELKISEQKFRNAYNRANFYKDLFIHDINNILQVIKSSSELISQFTENIDARPEFFMFLDMIDKQARKGEHLVSNIHKLSELEEKEEVLEPVDIFEILAEIIKSTKNTYQKKDLKISIKSLFNEYIIQANQLLENVFQNLLINSITYNENQRIEVIIKISEEFKDNQKYLKLEFIDNGIGIEEDRKKLIFQKGRKPSKVSKGLGFGLSLVKAIIEKYNGKIWVEDRVKTDPAKGSNFVILLPTKS